MEWCCAAHCCDGSCCVLAVLCCYVLSCAVPGSAMYSGKASMMVVCDSTIQAFVRAIGRALHGSRDSTCCIYFGLSDGKQQHDVCTKNQHTASHQGNTTTVKLDHVRHKDSSWFGHTTYVRPHNRAAAAGCFRVPQLSANVQHVYEIDDYFVNLTAHGACSK